MDAPRRSATLRLLADILDYPRPGLARQVHECQAMVNGANPRATDLLSAFGSFVQATSPGRLEEVYSAFFDLNPVCFPYVGYHLFGETYKRSAFLVALKERYRASGFEADERELPDRLSILLRFLSVSEDSELNSELITQGVVPALEKMLGKRQDLPESVPSSGSDVRLEGSSKGEVLGGGFLLQSIADDGGLGEAAAGAGVSAVNPYRKCLEALHLTLQALWPDQREEPVHTGPGGSAHA